MESSTKNGKHRGFKDLWWEVQHRLYVAGDVADYLEATGALPEGKDWNAIFAEQMSLHEPGLAGCFHLFAEGYKEIEVDFVFDSSTLTRRDVKLRRVIGAAGERIACSFLVLLERELSEESKRKVRKFIKAYRKRNQRKKSRWDRLWDTKWTATDIISERRDLRLNKKPKTDLIGRIQADAREMYHGNCPSAKVVRNHIDKIEKHLKAVQRQEKELKKTVHKRLTYGEGRLIEEVAMKS